MQDSEKFKLGTPDELLKEFASNLGYTLDNISFDTPITPEHLKINNKFEFKAGEVIDYLSEVTNMPKGSSFVYGLQGRLLEAVNNRLADEGKEPVTNLNSTILDQKDIENMVSLLDNEMSIKDTQHQIMKPGELKNFSAGIVSNLNDKRAGNEVNMEKVAKLGNSQSKGIGNLISEFFNKVKSLFKENIVTNSIKENKVANTTPESKPTNTVAQSISAKERLTGMKIAAKAETAKIEAGPAEEQDYRSGMTPTH
jgi:hypothetical protein